MREKDKTFVKEMLRHDFVNPEKLFKLLNDTDVQQEIRDVIHAWLTSHIHLWRNALK
jgi:spore cortex formation protein SpoVR/YcgB (stage V sporulation)